MSALLLLLALPASAQVATGTPPFNSFSGGPDIVNNGNLNDHWVFPIRHKPGRGKNFAYDLSYDSSVWYPVTAGSTTSWQPVNQLGWSGLTPTGYATHQTGPLQSCRFFQETQWITEYYHLLSNWVYVDSSHTARPMPETGQAVRGHFGPSGTAHPMIGAIQDGAGDCGPATDAVLTTNDGSGYKLSVPDETLYTPEGMVGVIGTTTTTDRNGNQITQSGGVYTDTLGTTALTVTGSGTAANPYVFTYTAPSGASAHYTLNYTNYTVATNFGNSLIHEYKSSAAVPLPTSLVLPDGSQYTFTYESTPSTPSASACSPYSGTTCVTARIASVTLPTGGTISYLYYNSNNNFPACTASNNGIFSDGSALCLQRTLNDGNNSNTWAYIRSQISGSEWTTTVSDPTTPTANQTLIYFQKDSNSTNPTPNFYETQRLAYQGSTSGQLLRQWTTCYNGNTTNCTTTAVFSGITQRNVNDQYGSNGLQCQHNYFYNSVGGLTERDDYDYGSGAYGALLRKTLITYASLQPNITSFRQTITICNGTGTSSSCLGASGFSTGTVVAQTNYNYDEPNTLSTVSPAVVQHTSVSGSRGNLTSINYPVSGLTAHFTYWDTGSIKTSQDVNSATTTYNYDSTNNNYCQMGFPTSITEPVGSPALSPSMTWKCIGGVMTQLTDENGNNSSISFTDAYYWRPASTTDQAGAITNICYAALTATGCPSTPSATQVETYMNFNSNTSTIDSLVTLDGLGRPHVQQTRQGPYASSSTFDSVETDYDALGRVRRATTLYRGTAGQTNSTIAATTTTYDALSRVYVITDAGGGTASYTYSPTSSDVTVAIGPIPTGSGESLKQRQYEYNSLGWLTSVCEITTILPGNGTCAQSSSPQPSGYWTKYTYDALGDLLTVTQNAQAAAGSQQSRTFAYDAMGRLTSETNPEMNQVALTYKYDSDTTCTPASSGDLLKRIDAVGNTTCYAYDLMHRLTAITYPSGAYATSTAQKHYVYDSATVNSIQMSNAKTRLAEAYTCTGTCSTKTTDLGLSYSQRGEITDVYEMTPHSGGTGAPFNHATASFWASGALNTIGGPVIPTLTYAVDTEGRTSNISASTGPNPVTSTTYSLYTTPPQQKTIFGSGDYDTFNLDANTFRPTQYQFKVGTQTVTGTVNWNSNGSLGSLNITDQFNPSNTQNCSYTADDLARINKGDCGTIWGQTFSYDAFGNIQKNVISGDGGTTFSPCYQASPSITNRISLVGGTGSNCTGGTAPTYDANGNSTNDTFRAFTWDAENRPLTVGSVTLTYDAFDRMVEQSAGGTNTEIVYLPTGGKLALMNGTSLIKAFAPLTSGATAVYTSGTGPAYYRHKDPLGSSRFASTPSQTLYSDTAYAPFGEPYASSGAIDSSYTGQNQDTTVGLYDFLFREQDPNQGRWTQPDPAGLAAVAPSNPQSWNRYAYVLNSPLNLIDPSGLDGCGDDWITDPSLQGPCGLGGFGGGGIGGGAGGALPWLFCDRYLDPFCGPAGWCDPGIDMNCGLSPGYFNLDLFNVPVNRVKNPCANATLSAAGVNPQQQIATAQASIAFGKTAANLLDDDNPVLNFFGGMFGYFLAVHTGGPNDIKNTLDHSPLNQTDVDAGNISFGITCPYGPGFCQRAAGFAQTVIAGNPDFRGTLATLFDSPSDNIAIQVGQARRAAGCHE